MVRDYSLDLFGASRYRVLQRRRPEGGHVSAVLGAVLGIMTGVLLTQARRLPLAGRALSGMAVVALAISAYVGTGRAGDTRTAWAVGLMTAVAVMVAWTFRQSWQGRLHR